MSEIILSEWILTLTHYVIILIFIIGLLCFFVRKRFIRQLVGLKLMLQSVSLGLIIKGWEKGDIYLSQTMVISALVIEAVIIGLALTMIIHIAKHAQDDQIIVNQNGVD